MFMSSAVFIPILDKGFFQTPEMCTIWVVFLRVKDCYFLEKVSQVSKEQKLGRQERLLAVITCTEVPKVELTSLTLNMTRERSSTLDSQKDYKTTNKVRQEKLTLKKKKQIFRNLNICFVER